MARLTLSAIVLATMYASSVMAQSQAAEAAAAPAAPSGSSGSAGGMPVVPAGCEKSVKVVTQGDLDAIKQCTVFKGTISMDNIAASELEMKGIEQLYGDLIMSGNLDMQTFSAPDLKKVQGQVKIMNHTILNKVNFPKLTEAKDFSYAVLPALEVINFPAGLTKVNNMRIEDTRAPKVDGFKPESLESFTLSSNNYMKSFDFSSVKEVTGDILVLGNNKALVFNAANLASIKTATFLNLNDVQMPALTTVKSDLSFHENEFMSLNLDKLEKIGGTLAIANNNKLAETSFKSLSMITGALSIGNNSMLNSIEGFPMLSEIHGTVDLAGGFNEYKLPALQDVRGGMRLQTTSDKFGCSDLEKKLKGENIVKGNTWSCSASMQESNMVPTVGSNPNVGGGKSGSSAGSSGSGSSGNGSNNNGQTQSSGASSLAQGSSLLAVAAVFIYSFVF